MDDFSLTVNEMETNGFPGTSGAGKTTTIWMLIGIL